MDRLGDDLMDQSCFNVGETCIRDSRMDNIAEMYAATLTPEALIQQRLERRNIRATMTNNSQQRQQQTEQMI